MQEKGYILGEIWALADKIAEYLELQENIKMAAVAGSIRRRCEIVSDIDIIISGDEPEKAINSAAKMPGIEHIITQSKNVLIARLSTGMPLEVFAVTPARFPAALHLGTGSKAYWRQLQSYAEANHLQIPELPGSEKDIYQSLKLQYIEPELREGLGEVEQAANNKLPALITERDIKGIFHVHTSYSDGRDSLSDIAAAAQRQGWSYLGITDHSQSASYAGGLKVESIRHQRREIDRLNNKNPNFRILAGIECDIRPDGSLDYSDDVLAGFDFVVASIHSAFRQGEGKMTARIIKAIENKYVTILGHPTGRLLLARHGYGIDLGAVIRAAADTGTVIEINSSPRRLDLDWRWCRKAKENEVMLSVNPDAHSIEELNYIKYGVAAARKGCLAAYNVLNTLPVEQIEKILKRKQNK